MRSDLTDWQKLDALHRFDKTRLVYTLQQDFLNSPQSLVRENRETWSPSLELCRGRANQWVGREGAGKTHPSRNHWITTGNYTSFRQHRFALKARLNLPTQSVRRRAVEDIADMSCPKCQKLGIGRRYAILFRKLCCTVTIKRSFSIWKGVSDNPAI